MIPDSESLTDGSEADRKRDKFDAFLRNVFQSSEDLQNQEMLQSHVITKQRGLDGAATVNSWPTAKPVD